MSLFKKALLFFLALPLLFIVSSFVAGQKSALAATCSQAPTLSLDRSVSPNPKDNPLNKVYTLKINNPNSINCTYLLKASTLLDNWGFSFSPVNNEATTLLNNEITIPQASCSTNLCKEHRQFKIRATPGTQPNPGTYRFKVEIYTLGSVTLDYVVPPPTATKDLDITTFNFPGGVDTETSDPTITIKNIGNAQITGNFNVKVENKQNHSGASQVWNVTQAVSAGESISHTFTNMPRPSAGSYTSLATVDSGNVINESNENNNTATDAYTTTPPSSNPPPASTCDKNPAKLEVTPTNRNGNKGDEKTYDVEVTNADKGTNCPSVDFTLSKNLPGDANTSWTGHFDDNKFSLKKGASKTTKLHVKSPNSATPEEKTVWVKVARANGLETSRSVTYTVVAAQPTKKPTAKPTKKPTAKPTKKPTDGPAPTNCERKTPEFSATPDSRTGDPGKGVKYTMVIKNKDQGPCATRKLSLGAKLPTSAWREVFAKENFDLAKGAQATIDVAVTSPAGATPGNKKITLNLKNNEGAVINSKEVTYVVPGVITPTPTISDDNGLLSVRIGVDGIGTTPRIPIGGNKNPENENRNLTLSLYNAATNTLTGAWDDWTFTYNPTTQKFENVLLLSFLPTGTYNVYAEGPRFIRARLPGSATITKGQTTNIHSDNFYLITGNINNADLSENRIDIMDYSVLISCSIYSQDTSLCDEDPNNASNSDLNDDGRVDEDDYTLFLKEFGNEGTILP